MERWARTARLIAWGIPVVLAAPLLSTVWLSYCNDCAGKLAAGIGGLLWVLLAGSARTPFFGRLDGGMLRAEGLAVPQGLLTRWRSDPLLIEGAGPIAVTYLGDTPALGVLAVTVVARRGEDEDGPRDPAPSLEQVARYVRARFAGWWRDRAIQTALALGLGFLAAQDRMAPAAVVIIALTALEAALAQLRWRRLAVWQADGRSLEVLGVWTEVTARVSVDHTRRRRRIPFLDHVPGLSLQEPEQATARSPEGAWVLVGPLPGATVAEGEPAQQRG